MLWFTLIIIILSAIIIQLINFLNYWKKRNVISTVTWPLLGEFKDMILQKRNMGEITLDCYNKFPNKRYYGTYVFNKPCLMVTDIDLIKKITVKDFDYFIDHIDMSSSDTDPLFSKNLVSLKGKKWREMRNTLSPSFTGNKIRVMFRLISDCAKQLNQYFLQKPEEIIEIEAKDVMTRIATDVIATTAFGIGCDSLKEENEFYKMGRLMTQGNVWAFFKMMLLMTFPKLMKILGVSQLPKKTTDFFGDVIKETLKERREKKIIRPDMIHIMMEAQKGKKRLEEIYNIPDTGFAVAKEEHNEKINTNEEEHSSIKEITVEDIIAQGFLFFIAGYDIVSTMVAFLCYELAVNPEIQKELQSEIDEVFEKINGDLNYEMMVQMKYLDMVVSELLRKWPLGTVLNRECVRDYKIPASEYHQEVDIIVEKGVAIMIPVYGIHRDPKFYPNPEKFDPERFNDENKHKINSYAYLPFGIGPRNCIGSRLALLETKVIIVYLLSKFELIVIDKTEIPLVLSPKRPVVSPESFWLGLQKRK